MLISVPPAADKRQPKGLVLGLGTRGGGEGAARYLASRGFHVRVSDTAPPRDYLEVLDRLSVYDEITYTLGRHERADVEWADVVVRNPAIPNSSPFLEHARELGRVIHTDLTILLRDHPGTIVGVTGTKGKTSTCHFLHHFLAGHFDDAKLLGNMGGPTLDALDGATSRSIAALEISSFHIETMAELGITVPVAILTNLGADHLDRYPDLETYWASKYAMFELQGPDDWRVTPPAGALPASFPTRLSSRWFCVGSDDPEAEGSLWVEGDELRVSYPGAPERLPVDRAPELVGHRRENLFLAVAGALIAGCPAATIVERLASLPEVPHRQELVVDRDGIRWINDTSATNPMAAAAGIEALGGSGPLVAICGGSDKGLDAAPLVEALAEWASGTILLDGTGTDKMLEPLQLRGVEYHGPVPSMREAVARAREMARPGGVVVLAPGCASFGMFEDEFDRAGHFITEVLDVHGIPTTEEQQRLYSLPRRAPMRELLDR